MADITKCANGELCRHRDLCYRWTAPANPQWQPQALYFQVEFNSSPALPDCFLPAFIAEEVGRSVGLGGEDVDQGTRAKNYFGPRLHEPTSFDEGWRYLGSSPCALEVIERLKARIKELEAELAAMRGGGVS